MMENYTKVYGRYAELEFRMKDVQWSVCPCCDKETLEFLMNDEHEVIGCTECTTTKPSMDDQYMVDTDEGTYLKCPACGEICDTLYADKKVPWVIDGCDKCLEWVDAFEEVNNA